MNLLHHLVVAETLREKLLWSPALRGQILLGAIAPDAHTEVPGLGRSMFHPKPGEDLVASALDLASGSGCPTHKPGRVFLVSVIAHLVADELTRKHDYHLPPHAPTGFQPVEFEDFDAPGVINTAAITRSLMRVRSECSLGPLHADAIDRKRWEVLGRWPLADGPDRCLIVEPLLTLVRHCAGEALMRMYRSDAGAALLGSWRT